MSEKPLIYLFEEIEKKYLYDANTNRIFNITDDIYDLLQNSLDENEIYKLCERNKDIEYLFKEGLLKKSYVKTIKHPLSNYIEDILENYVESINLQVTQNCNLKCRYCSYSGDGILDRKRSTSKMELTVAMKSIDFLYEHSRKANSVSISFYGGEPLLNFDLIKKVVKYANNKFVSKCIEYRMTTNGTIMNEEILELLTMNNFKLAVSLDGPKDIHDRNRRMMKNGLGTHDLIKKNLRFIKRKNYKFYKGIIFNSVNELDINLYNTIDYFENDIIVGKNIVILNQVNDQKINLSYPMTEEYVNSKKLFVLNNLINDKNLKKHRIVLEDLKNMEKLNVALNSKFNLNSEFQHGGVCIPGVNKMIVDYKGDIRICERTNELSNDAIIGNIYDGFNIPNIKKLLNIGNITEHYCNNCWAIRLCTQCAAQLIDIGELNVQNKLMLCKESIRNAKEVLKKYVIMKEIQKICQELEN